MMHRRRVRQTVLLIAATCALASAGSRASAAAPFYLGGDVSLLPFIESKGGTFRDGGVVQPADHILVDRGANLFRLRLFVNPNTSYAATSGAIQDLNYTIALAKRLEASGAGVLLDLHYSDTWADPGHQAKPAAWGALSYAALQGQVRAYTRQTLESFAAAGVTPDMVQVGNETTNGMLFPSGQVTYTGSTTTQNASWAAFGGLLNAGISGVRDVDAETGKHTQVALHIDGGDVQGRAQYVFNQLATVGGVSPASYDIAGLSFYPTTTGGLANLQANMSYAATTLGRQVMVLEANSPWKGTATGSGYAATPAGQKAFLVAVRDAVKAVPNGKGLGAVWWYPESIQVPGTNIYNGGASALFDDSGGDALPALDAFDVAAPTWSLDADARWGSASSWSMQVPDGAGQTARFESAITAPRTIALDGPRVLGAIRFRSANTYTLAGADTLTLLNTGGPSRVDVLAGRHVIAAPVVLDADAQLNAAWDSQLVVAGPITSVGTPTLTKLGSGTVELSRVHVGTIDLEFGTFRLTAGGGGAVTAVTNSLTIQPGTTFDLTDNTLAIESPAGSDSASVLAKVRSWLESGQLTSRVASAGHAIGYFAGHSIITRTAFDGTTIDDGAVVLQLTLQGDANLDGAVDFSDLLSIARSYGSSANATWQGGDSNYDGAVDFTDLLALARNYGTAANQPAPADAPPGFAVDWTLAVAVSPEPTSALVLAGIVVCNRRSRRRRRSV